MYYPYGVYVYPLDIVCFLVSFLNCLIPQVLSIDRLKPDATPYALFTPQHILLPLRPNVEQELARMESRGVPNQHTNLLVCRHGHSVCICVDLKSERLEVHPLLTVDETLAWLTGARMFSKLDANSDFWQIPLAERTVPPHHNVHPPGPLLL